MENDLTSDELLYTLVRQFEDSEETTRPAREKSERDRDYYDEKQHTADEESELRKRGQPVVTFNEIKPKVNTMLGLEKQSRKDPKAFPRTPDDEDAAQAATDAIRYVCEDSRWDDKRSQAAKELAIEGTCAIMVGVKAIRNKSKLMGSTALSPPEFIDPDIRRIAWDRFYYDPASSEFDFSDAKFMGVVIWMDLDDAVRKYPDAKEALETTWRKARDSQTYDDKPKWGLWADYKRKRVRICEHYWSEGEWKFAMFTQAGFVVEPQASPYMGDDGEPECPIKAVSLYIDRDNNRYGEVRTMVSPQDEVNKRRSKSLHLISQRQIRVSQNVAVKPADVRKELARPDGVFIGEPGDVEILPTNDMAMGNLQLMQDARGHIQRTGPNASLAGKNEQDLSGRAIIAQQQGGIVESATFLDCIRVLSLAVYRSVWSRIQQYWDAPRWLRVTDNENNIRFVGINRPVTALQQMAQQMGVTRENMAEAPPEVIQQLQLLASDPRAQQIVAIENNVAELDVDIIVDEGFDTPTIAAEQFSELTKLAQSGFPIPPDVLIEASSLRNKDRLLEMLKQGPTPEQQQAALEVQEIAKAGAIAEVEKTQSETAKNLATAEKTQSDTMVGAIQAGAQVAA